MTNTHSIAFIFTYNQFARNLSGRIEIFSFISYSIFFFLSNRLTRTHARTHSIYVMCKRPFAIWLDRPTNERTNAVSLYVYVYEWTNHRLYARIYTIQGMHLEWILFKRIILHTGNTLCADNSLRSWFSLIVNAVNLPKYVFVYAVFKSKDEQNKEYIERSWKIKLL